MSIKSSGEGGGGERRSSQVQAKNQVLFLSLFDELMGRESVPLGLLILHSDRGGGGGGGQPDIISLVYLEQHVSMNIQY